MTPLNSCPPMARSNGPVGINAIICVDDADAADGGPSPTVPTATVVDVRSLTRRRRLSMLRRVGQQIYKCRTLLRDKCHILWLPARHFVSWPSRTPAFLGVSNPDPNADLSPDLNSPEVRYVTLNVSQKRPVRNISYEMVTVRNVSITTAYTSRQ